jgi:hypothetical protein
MHSTDKKSAIYLFYLLAILALIYFFLLKDFVTVFFEDFVYYFDKFPILGLSILFTSYYLISLTVEKNKHNILLILVHLTLSLVLYNITKIGISLFSYWNVFLFSFVLFFSVAIPFLFYKFWGRIIKNILDAATNEKSSYSIMKKHPYLICTEHHLRPDLKKRFGYKNINCRMEDKCLADDKVIYAKNIIGVLGKDVIHGSSNDNYYIPIWNENEQRIDNADYDIIEIHESSEIKDYNAVINKIIDFLYNEINRYKPINEVVVKIIGNPQISESTKRRLEEHFFKVE